eukprot:gene16098-17719_t
MSLRSLKRGSLVIRNLQKVVKLDTKLLKADVYFLRKCLGMDAYDVSVVCIGKLRMQNLNQQTRDRNEPTEILSFPYHLNANNGKLPSPIVNPCDFNLGDIYLCVPLVKERCCQRGISLRVNLLRYVAHGLCHLIGYSHHTETNWKLMYRKEKEILALLSYYRGIEYGPCNVRNLIPGQTKLWCACGLSKKQPWCDGSHKGTGIEPLRWKVPTKLQSTYELCGCKHTKCAPLCDASHTSIPLQVRRRQEECKEEHPNSCKLCTGCGWTPEW